MKLARPGAIVVDIEGTTSSLAFVHDVLFPYARHALPDFVRAHQTDPEIAAALREVGAQTEEAIATLVRWIDEDRKERPLKVIQGRIWSHGYAAGTLKGHVYPDAAAALRMWHHAGIPLYVYSSGSIQAQQLIFGYSIEGDLRPLFRDYFDTTVGSKLEPASYAQIAAATGVAPNRVLFLSDNPAELRAALRAGTAAIGLERGAPLASLEGLAAVRSFEDLEIAVHA